MIEVGGEGEYFRFEADISEHVLPGKMMRLRELGVDTLICGAISGRCANMVTTAGIELIPWITGQVEDVLRAFLGGNLFDTQFLMPGHPDYWNKRQGKGYGRVAEQEDEVSTHQREAAKRR